MNVHVCSRSTSSFLLCTLLIEYVTSMGNQGLTDMRQLILHWSSVGANCRWQEEEEDHRHQVSALKLAQEALAGRLSQEEEHRTAAEGEVARQRACIGRLRSEVAEFGDALQSAKAQVIAEIKYSLLTQPIDTILPWSLQPKAPLLHCCCVVVTGYKRSMFLPVGLKISLLS